MTFGAYRERAQPSSLPEGKANDMARITTVILDADDTLWHNEKYFQIAETRFLAALAPYANGSSVRQELAKCIVRNIDAYGYGAKSFTLSMIETAIRSG